ncbi:hypothetical protein CI610_02936 [invertebrate metagenome]|uniref:Virulence-associated protein E-like domain-containing protein n=1 Tax=invertebrate metagenome TaxID=1711999 RepID=A0A2H9T4G7_9ZZZZ
MTEQANKSDIQLEDPAKSKIQPEQPPAAFESVPPVGGIVVETADNVVPFAPTRIDNSLDLVTNFIGSQQQQPHWHTVKTASGEHIDYAEHEDRVVLWAQTNDLPSKLYTERGLSAAYRIIQRSSYKRLISEVVANLSRPADRDGDSFTSLADMIGLNEVDQLCLMGWMIDRKRSLIEISQGRHPKLRQTPMPIFYSKKQKTGKSTLVQSICDPFRELSEVKDLDEIEDKFNYLQWGKLLIANFDEMAGLGRTDMNKLKKWATQSVFTKRRIQSEQQHRILKTTGGIGSSNDPIAEIIWDSSGTRRFCQIDVVTDGRLHKAVAEIDFINVWRGIDHQQQLSQTEQDLIFQAQDGQRRKDKVEVWFDEQGEQFLKDRQQGVKGSDLYSNFREWCTASGEKEYTNTSFGRKLMDFYDGRIEKRKTMGLMKYLLP